jgi:hypothetical protein
LVISETILETLASFELTLDKQNALNFQLLGGVWILQTLPAIVFGLFTRWFHRCAADRLGGRHDPRHRRGLRLLHGLHSPTVRQLAGGR